VAWATFHGNYAYVKLAPEGLQGGMTGALLLTRDGIGARGQYNLGEGWRDIYDYSPQYGDDKFTLQVWAWGGGGGGQPVEVHFDNYQINGPNVHVSKSPLGALLLLD
jgi:hypothetical protein